VDELIGDASRARRDLDWVPSVTGPDLARLMVEADIEALKHAGRAWIDTVPLPWWKTPVTQGA
jgi:GDPmannose 4,6-dehydratase